MRQIQKKLFGLVCIFLFAIIFQGIAFAANGKLSINYDIDGVTFNIYHVAEKQSDGSFAGTETFGEYQVNWNSGDRQSLAVTLSAYVSRDKISPTASSMIEGGTCSFSELENGLYLILGEQVSINGYKYVPTPVIVEINEENAVVNVKHDGTPEKDQPEFVSYSVKKIWCGEADPPQSVTVQLLKDRKLYDEVILNEENNWSHTWEKLDDSSIWQVAEKEVPSGYTVSIVRDGYQFQIINTIEKPPVPPSDDTMLTVRKVWEDYGSKNRPDSIIVHLLRDGKYYDEVELSESNQWIYTWSQLDEKYDWSVVEANKTEDYKVSYEIVGNTVIITNTLSGGSGEEGNPKEKVEIEPEGDLGVGLVSLTVRKVWEGDSNHLTIRPESVGITLYCGKDAVETVWLGEWNNWSYSWENLSGNGEWSVAETNIPKGYTPYYRKNNHVVTITNTATLVQTGQLNWPIPVLGGLGIVMLLLGGYMILGKRKKNES